jgi:hypothetical protein
MPKFKENPNAMKPSGFKMKGPSMHSGTRAHKEAIKLNRSMDQSSMPDGRAKSSAFQKKDKGSQKPSKAMHADNPSTPVDTSPKDYTRGGKLMISGPRKTGSKKTGSKSIGSKIKTGVGKIKTGVDKIASKIGLKKTGDIGAKMKQKYSGAAQRAGKVAKPGESQHQFKTRTRKSTSKAKTGHTGDDVLTKNIKNINQKGDEQIRAKKATVANKPKVKPKAKGPDWNKAPKVGTQARTSWYQKNKLALDKTTPGYGVIRKKKKKKK